MNRSRALSSIALRKSGADAIGSSTTQAKRAMRRPCTRSELGRCRARGGIRTLDLPITSRMFGVGLDGSRRIEPAHVGCPVGSDGSRRTWKDRLMIIGMIKAHRIIELDAKGGKRRELTLCAEPPPQHRTGLETCWQRSRTPGDTELLAFEAATENYLQREVMRGSGKAAESRSFIPGRDAGQLGRPRALSGRGCSTLTPGVGPDGPEDTGRAFRPPRSGTRRARALPHRLAAVNHR
jgi:hypothetical protein